MIRANSTFQVFNKLILYIILTLYCLKIGVEGTEGITSIVVSPAKKYVAICEKAERALCTVYDLNTLKRKKTLTSSDYQAKEFLSVAFSA